MSKTKQANKKVGMAHRLLGIQIAPLRTRDDADLPVSGVPVGNMPRSCVVTLPGITDTRPIKDTLADNRPTNLTRRTCQTCIPRPTVLM